MKADYRLGMLAFAAGLASGSPALAQSVPQNSSQNAPPPTIQIAPPRPATSAPRDTVGPSELQNFSLGGTVTRPAEAPPRTAAPNPSSSSVGVPATRTARATPPATARDSTVPARSVGRRDIANAAPAQANVPTFTPDLSAPAATGQGSAPPAVAPPPAFTPEADTTSPGLGAGHGPSILPWLLAALALAAGLGFLLWRRRPREALAGGPSPDRYSTEPAVPTPAPVPMRKVAAPPRPPIPAPAPAPAAASAPGSIRAFAQAPVAPPQPAGIVSTRLRPWLDVTMVPMTCRMDEGQVTFEFEIDAYNSGAAPARDIHIAATMFNAGPSQDQDIAAFIARPFSEGEPLPPIPPLQRITFRTSLTVQRASLQLFEAGARQVFVPVLAFNASYRWSGGVGQTAGSSLIGRDTGAEKLAPLRGDAGPRAFGGLGARLLPTGLRN
jgi:hypothetical protein